jgi:hypothetical protein
MDQRTVKQVSTPTHSQIKRVKRRQQVNVDYFSELRSWVQHAMLESEENKDFNKKSKFLDLLKDLENRPIMVSAI